MPTQPRKMLAFLALLFASCAWGAVFLFGKWALDELSPLDTVTLRFLIASAALLPLTLRRKEWPRRADWPAFLTASFLGVPLAMYLLFTGLKLTGAVVTSLLLGAFPVLLSGAAVLFEHERLGWRGWTATLASTLGVALIVGSPHAQSGWLGPVLVLASLVCFSAWVVISRRLMRTYSPGCVTNYVVLLGTLMLLPLSRLDGPWPELGALHAATWWSLAVLGLVCTALTYHLWNWGLKQLGTHTSGVIGNLEPLTGALLGVLVLGEPLGLGLLAGGALILGAAVSVSL